MRYFTIATLTLTLLLPALGSEAATLLWSADTPVLNQDIDVDFEGILTGITAVEVRMAGYAGGQHGYCQDMGGEDTYFWLSFTFTFDLEGSAGGFTAPSLEDYDLSAPLGLIPGTPDWSFLNDGRAVLHISFDDNYTFNMIDCYPIGYESPTATTLELEVTCDTIVATEPMTWSSVKTLYR